MRVEPSDSIVATVVAAGQVISNRPCIVQGLILNPAAVSCTVALYDPAPFVEGGTPTTTSATLKISMSAAAAGGSPTAAIAGSGVAFQNGCVAVVAGTGATATVIFAKI
jgi:hypothetical protein